MFRRYEPLIAEGVRNYPAATKFTPGPEIGLTTFTARFRDAVTSFRRYNWLTSVIDVDKFINIVGAFVIKSDANEGCVWFCKRAAAGRAPAGVTVDPTSIPTASPATPSGILADATPAEISAFVLLISNGRLNGPVLFHGDISPYVDSVNFNVGLSYDTLSNISTLL
jgi:hypothetical protein